MSMADLFPYILAVLVLGLTIEVLNQPGPGATRAEQILARDEPTGLSRVLHFTFD